MGESGPSVAAAACVVGYPGAGAATTADKVAFLSTPELLPERTRTVQVLETHYAWLFFSERHVYKFKKPIQGPRLDYRSLPVRRAMCEQEISLNRRLAPKTYLAVEPLVRTVEGGLALGESGDPIEWVIKMNRLPAALMMDVAVPEGRVREDDILRLARKLSAFYCRTSVAPIGPEQYLAKLTEEMATCARVLVERAPEHIKARIPPLNDALIRFVNEQSDVLIGRVGGYFIRDGHGDLRPDHVCLHADLPIIDCLEFDPSLRYLDCLEELAFLGMECRLLGKAWIEQSVLRNYRECSGDVFPMGLANFYAARRALTRAMLMVWRNSERPSAGRSLKRAVKYLDLVDYYLAGPI